jgi:hypothetical protein
MIYFLKVYFLYTLTILFIGLKLTHYIDWSWWFILLPLYGEFVLVFGVGIIGFICAFLLILKDELIRKFREIKK